MILFIHKVGNNFRSHYYIFNMPSNDRCIACQARNPSFVFPSERSLKFKWMNILGLEDVPHARAKLCPLHFPPDKVFFDGSRMALLEGAEPLAKVNTSYHISDRFMYFLGNSQYHSLPMSFISA